VSKPLITGVSFSEEGVEIGYIRVPQDVRKNGLQWQHSVLIPFRSDYDDELETFAEALQALLEDALDDEATAEPIEPTDDEDDEEDDE
jgi:hypothetical protein